jgi:hypothetical protein
MTDLHKMTLGELQELKGQVDTMIQMQQPALRVGQVCTVEHDKTRGMIGEIIKVNRTKCKVMFDGQANTWNVPKGMITVVGVSSPMQC